MNRLIPILIALLVGLSSCSDSNDTPDPDVPTPGALNRYLCLNVAVAGGRESRAEDGTTAGEDDGYDPEHTIRNNENMVSAITAIIYPASADINNNASADATTVRAFSWKVTASKYTGTQATGFTTGPRLLPSDLSEGDYKLLVIANLDYAAALDGQKLSDVRDLMYPDLPYSSSSSDPDKAYDPLYTKDFIMTSIKEVKLSLYSAPANGGIGNTGNKGSQNNPFVPDESIQLDRLAARVDLALEEKNRNEYTHSDGSKAYYYEYPVIDETGTTVGKFQLTHAMVFNISKNQFLFKHTSEKLDVDKLQVPGRETQEWKGNKLCATNYVVDPLIYNRNTAKDFIRKFFVYDFYHDNITANKVFLEKTCRVPNCEDNSRFDSWTDATNKQYRYYTIAYSAENTVMVDYQEAQVHLLRTAYLTGIRFYGRYILNNGVDKQLAFDYFIRHSWTSGEVDTSQPMAYGVVRNNIYRVYINSIHSRKGDFTIKLNVDVLPWQKYTHSGIYM